MDLKRWKVQAFKKEILDMLSSKNYLKRSTVLISQLMCGLLE